MTAREFRKTWFGRGLAGPLPSGVAVVSTAAFFAPGGKTDVAAFAAVATVASAAFFVHGLEFRYDPAILVLLLPALRLLANGSPRAFRARAGAWMAEVRASDLEACP